MSSTENSATSESHDGGKDTTANPLTAANARTLRLMIHMYEAGWNDCIDAGIRAKHDTVNPMKTIRKLLEEFQASEEAVTKPDVKKPSSEAISKLR